MSDVRASIIIPTYNHATVLPSAVRSCLEQTVEVDVIVVDDGSTDDPQTAIKPFGERVRYVRIPHSGPCVARNTGLDLARREFVMFLDADDVLDPQKVAVQIAALEASPDLGWMLSDVLIEDAAKNRTSTASAQYRYDDKPLSGWIGPLLELANFIPIMSPLVRRDVLEQVPRIRFDDQRVPEDWHFWYAVACRARVGYVDRVLATYRHGKTGRSRLPKRTREVSPTMEHPLRLNLGCGTRNTRSWHPIKGLINLDKSMGWKFEDGLRDFLDESVAGITVSHSLMYVHDRDWPAVCTEFARVLKPGGVVRITEDSTQDPASSRIGGWKGSDPAVTLTTPEFVRRHLEAAGLTVFDVDKGTSRFEDLSLCQAQHGDPPDVFFLEGIKRSRILFAPHSDDETLFASFTILRVRPHVVICCESAGDYGDTVDRFAETRSAMAILGAPLVEQWPGGDVDAIADRMLELDAQLQPDEVYAPFLSDEYPQHPDHRTVAIAAARVFGDRVTAYLTYGLTTDGPKRERPSTIAAGIEAPFELDWIAKKLKALACYSTQIRHPRAHRFFMADLFEYYVKGKP